MANCQRLVRASGVEATLETLREQGVCIGWDEFKGRVPVRRAGREWLFSERDFDNPFAREHFRASSSGTSGRPVRTRMDLEDMDEATADWAVWFDAHGWIGRPLIFWETEGTGLASRYLKCARFGMPFRKWFISTRGDEVRAPLARLRRTCHCALGRPSPATGVSVRGRSSPRRGFCAQPAR